MSSISVTTKSKRRSRKRKYQEMAAETKIALELQKRTETETQLKSTVSRLSSSDSECETETEVHTSDVEMKEKSDSITPTPSSSISTTNTPSISPNHKSTQNSLYQHSACVSSESASKADLDELTYLIRGLEVQKDKVIDWNSQTLGILRLCQWLQSERNQSVLQSVGTQSVFERLTVCWRQLSTIQTPIPQIHALLTAILLLLFQFIRHSLELSPVSVQLLIGLLPHSVSIHRLSDWLKSLDPPKSSRRRSKRRLKKKGTDSMARDVIKWIEAISLKLENVDNPSIGFAASILLNEIIVAENVKTEIIEHLQTPSVLLNLSKIIQTYCISLEQSVDKTAVILQIESQLVLLERITRKVSKCHDAALLILLDAIGMTLRFAVETVDSTDSVDTPIIEKDSVVNRSGLLRQSLSVLVNVTNERTIGLQPDTVRSLCTALHTVHSVDSDSFCLILAVFINLAQRSRTFRDNFDQNCVNKLPVIEYLVRHLQRHHAECEEREGVRNHQGFYMAFLLGFLLQNAAHFKVITRLMTGDLTAIHKQLTLYAVLVHSVKPEKDAKATDDRHRKRTQVIIEKVLQVVQLRMGWLKRQK